jgi:hypothetical protein
MRTKAIEAYDAWHIVAPTMYPRSELYCLAPIGIGTARVEGLASYLMRLAEAHHVELGALVDLIGSYLSTPCRYRVPALRVQRLCERWREIPSVELTLNDWVGATEKLTLRTDLSWLTMLGWAELIDLRSVYRYERTWCPYCYEEVGAAEQPIYEPLLWNVKEVRLCIRHLRPLRRECNHCCRVQSTVLRSSRAGYCALCSGWLGALDGEAPLPDGEDPERQKWTVLNIEGLASVNSDPPRRLSRGQLAARLRTVERSNFRLFAKRPIYEIRAYLNGERPPSLALLLDLCWELEIGLSDFLTSDTVWSPPRSAIHISPQHLPVLSHQARNM